MQGRSSDGLAALTDKEKQTLRLIVRGHDAKSAARTLGLSVHIINERLRDARRKLAVSSSREAARLLLEHEGNAPETVVDQPIGAAEACPHCAEDEVRPTFRTRKGALIMTLALSLLALVAVPQIVAPPDGGTAPAARPAAEEPARAFLALLDQGRWDDSYAMTGASFHAQNTLQVWASASEQARRPLGAVRRRALLSAESVPVPPAGAEIVKFRTSFAYKPDAVETVSLAREHGQWKIVGIWIE